MKPVVLPQVARALDEWLRSEGPHTRRAYEADLREYAKAVRAESSVHAVHDLVTAGPLEAARLVGAYLRRASKVLAQATVRRRASAIRSAVAAARRAGLVVWALELRLPKPETATQAMATAPRSMEGIDEGELVEVRAALDRDPSRMALRDRAIIELAVNAPYLRRSEIVLLDVGHIDFRRRRVTVLGKGRLEPEKLPLSPVGAKALRRWLEVRGGHRAAPVFIRLDRGARGEQRLTDQSIYDIALARGLKASIARMRPHGLRHLGITRLANYVDGQGLPVGEGMKLSRHRKEETYRGYIDRKGTLQDRIVEALDEVHCPT